MAPIILGNPSGIGNINNILVPNRNEYSIPYAEGGALALGNSASSDAFVTGTVIFVGTNLTVNTSENGVSQYMQLSVADPSAAANSVYAGNNISLSTNGINTTVSVVGLDNYAVSWHSHPGSYFDLSNSTLLQYTSNNSLSLAASQSSLFIPTNSSTRFQSTGNYLTTAANSTHIHGAASGTNITIGSSSNGLALSVGNYLTTAANSTHIHGSINTVTTTGSVLLNSSSSNGLTLGIPNWVTEGGNNITLSGNTGGTLTQINSGVLTIVGGNNITLSQSGGNAFTIIGNAPGTGGAGTGFTADLTTGGALLGTLDSNGLHLGVPGWLTTAMQSNLSTRFAGIGSAITGGSMTFNTGGLSLNIPSASATADNSVYAGSYISLSTNGVSTTVSAINLQPTSAMSLYQLTANNSLSLGTEAANSFVNTAFSTLLQHTSQNSLSLAVSQSSVFQLMANSTLSLGTAYSSHTHSQYLNASVSTAYQTSVLSNTFALTNHTHTDVYAATNHTHGNVAVTGGIGVTSASNGLSMSLPSYITTAALSNHSHGNISLSLDSLSGSYSSASNGLTISLTNSTHAHPYINSSETGSVYFSNNSLLTFSSSSSNNSTSIYIGSIAGGGGTSFSTVSTNGSLLVGSINSNGLSLSVPSWVTDSGGGDITFSAGSVSNSLNNIVFSNSNRVSFGLTGSTITASIPNGTVYFSDGNGITFGSSTDGISTTITASAASVADSINLLSIGGNTAGTANTYTNGTIVLAGGSNITLSQSSNTISFIGGANGIALQGSGTYSQNTGTIQFANSNGLIFGLTENQLTGSYSQSTHEHPYINTSISSQFLTTAALSNHTHSDLYVNTSISSQWLTTAALSNHTHAYVGQGTTTGSTAGSDIVITLNSNGMSMGIPAWLTTARASNDGIGLNTAGTNVTWTVNSSGISFNGAGYAGTGTTMTGASATLNSLGLQLNVPHGTVYFADSNGHSFSSSTSGVSTTIYIVT